MQSKTNAFRSNEAEGLASMNRRVRNKKGR